MNVIRDETYRLFRSGFAGPHAGVVIWAFGVVLYEMLTARRLFGGEDVSHTLAYVLTKEVEWNSLPDAPETLRRLLRRCLRRDQRKRLRDIGDARTELEEVLAGTVEAGATPRTRPDFPWWSTASPGLSMLILGAAVSGVALWSMGESADTRVERFEMTPRRPGAMGNAPTPDGREVVFVASEDTGQLHVRSLDQLEVRTLSGLGSPTHPFFSPDGEWIEYIDGAQLKRVSMATENRTFVATENCTLLGRTSRAERTFSR